MLQAGPIEIEEGELQAMAPRERATVLLIDQIGEDGEAILRPAWLPDGCRATNRQRLLMAILATKPTPWFVALLDPFDLPQHLVLLFGRKEADESAEFMEAAIGRSTEQGRIILSSIAHLIDVSKTHRPCGGGGNSA